MEASCTSVYYAIHISPDNQNVSLKKETERKDKNVRLIGVTPNRLVEKDKIVKSSRNVTLVSNVYRFWISAFNFRI